MNLKVEGLDELEAVLGELNGRNVFRNFLVQGANTIVSRAGEYAPLSVANMPKAHGAWYVRGTGTRYRRLDGVITERKTSENLKGQWNIKSRGGNNPSATIENRASYAAAVHGTSEQQASIHAGRGWKQLQKVAEEELPKIEKNILAQIDKLLR